MAEENACLAPCGGIPVSLYPSTTCRQPLGIKVPPDFPLPEPPDEEDDE